MSSRRTPLRLLLWQSDSAGPRRKRERGGVGAATSSADLADDGPHLLPAECAKGRRADIALPCDRQQRCGECLVVGGLDCRDNVVRTEGPPGVGEADAEALERTLRGFVAVDGVLEVADALVSPVDQRDVRGHGVLPSWQWPRRRGGSRTARHLKEARP